ncbi:MAG: hypothetical protein WC505_07950 [Patescibacteria group bacterium]
MQDISGFAPGLDPTVPGVVIDCTNMLPSTNGMVAAGQGADIGADALVSQSYGAACLLQLDGSSRMFAATSTAIYELVSGSWVDRSKGGGYTANGDWDFAQFGNVTIATNYKDAVQSSTTGAFADLAGTPPKARLVATAPGFVMLFSYNDGVNTFGDGWWCSGLYDHTTWMPSPSTQAANGRLFDTVGEITAAKSLGSAMAVYKDDAVYLGQYVGPPVIWQWTLVATDSGAYSQGSVVNVAGVHYFLGNNGLFMYDGSRPVPIGAQEVREWLRQNINPEHVGNIVSGYDSKRSIVFWFFPSMLSTGICDECIAYNTVTGKFGRFTKNVTDLVDFRALSLTWGDVGALASTWGAVGDLLTTWNDPILMGASVGLSFMSADGKLYKMDSNATNSSLTTGDFGDDVSLTTIKRVKPRFLRSPDSAQITHYYKRNEGDTLTQGVTVSMNDGKFDLLKSDRWHRVKFSFVGNCEITAFDAALKSSGVR